VRKREEERRHEQHAAPLVAVPVDEANHGNNLESPTPMKPKSKTGCPYLLDRMDLLTFWITSQTQFPQPHIQREASTPYDDGDGKSETDSNAARVGLKRMYVNPPDIEVDKISETRNKLSGGNNACYLNDNKNMERSLNNSSCVEGG